MSHPSDSNNAAESTIQIPEWDNNARKPRPHASDTTVPRKTHSTLKNRLDAFLPPHRTYVGLPRRTFLILLVCLVLGLLALIIGLAVGLNRRSSYQNLPLPSNAQTFTGDLTYYGTGLGACGITSTDSDYIVSISHIVFDAASQGSDPNANPLCGRMIRAARFDEQAGERRSVDLKVVDRCTGCQPTDLDTSTGVFDHLAARASGRVDVTWAWLSPAATGS